MLFFFFFFHDATKHCVLSSHQGLFFSLSMLHSAREDSVARPCRCFRKGCRKMRRAEQHVVIDLHLRRTFSSSKVSDASFREGGREQRKQLSEVVSRAAITSTHSPVTARAQQLHHEPIDEFPKTHGFFAPGYFPDSAWSNIIQNGS